MAERRDYLGSSLRLSPPLGSPSAQAQPMSSYSQRPYAWIAAEISACPIANHASNACRETIADATACRCHYWQSSPFQHCMALAVLAAGAAYRRAAEGRHQVPPLCRPCSTCSC